MTRVTSGTWIWRGCPGHQPRLDRNGLDPATTLHNVRSGRRYRADHIDDFVWVFEISGAVPPPHFAKGYARAVSERQPPMYFPKGGGTIKGESKPGEIVWSRVYIQEGSLHADIGRGTSVGQISDIICMPHCFTFYWKINLPFLFESEVTHVEHA